MTSSTNPSKSRVYVIILNWNGWLDTIECLESVFCSNYANYRVIVCDNGSDDESLKHIKAWADGRLNLLVSHQNPLRRLSFPPVTKPINYIEYDRAKAEQGGDSSDVKARLVLMQTGCNLGFAGGNNVGLRYALLRNDFDYVWLLNNDTVVEPYALHQMVLRMSERVNAGICGSTINYYYGPDRVQALGGAAYNKWFGTPKRIHIPNGADVAGNAQIVERQMAYALGASMLVSKTFLLDVGILSEDYFLCFEELDWAMRARGRYDLAFAPCSVVYHKDGRSIGPPTACGMRSILADYYNISNRIVFTRKFHPWALPTVYIGLFVTTLNRIRRGQWDRAMMILRIMLWGGRVVNADFTPNRSLISLQSDHVISGS